MPDQTPAAPAGLHLRREQSGSRQIIWLTGRLDAAGAPLLAQELDAALAQPLDGLQLDLDACPYVSSVGLRELLRAQKALASRGGRVTLRNVTPAVREILDLTGFTALLDVQPRRREISVQQAELLSAGVCGECFRIDAETVVKLYHEGVAPEVAEQEKAFAKAAFVLGIPTAISYDVVSCGTRTGIVYELLDARLFSTVIRNAPEEIDAHAATLAQVARMVHATPADPAVFPDFKERFRRYIAQMDFFLSPEDIAYLQERLDRIPDSDRCVHFDLHSSNIMMRDGEPVIIDMGDFSRGSYLFDLGLLYMIYGLPELGVSEQATKVPTALGVTLWERFLVHYFADRPEAELEFFEANRHFLAALRPIYVITYLPSLRDDCARIVRDVLLPRMRAEG